MDRDDGEFEMIYHFYRGQRSMEGRGRGWTRGKGRGFINRKSRDSATRFYAFSRVEINIFFSEVGNRGRIGFVFSPLVILPSLPDTRRKPARGETWEERRRR